MERKIEVFLNKWKKDIIRKPLLLYGPRQVGKTYSVLTFGKTNYKNVAYINTFNNSKVLDLFTKEKATDKLIKGLSTISGTTILENDTLVICCEHVFHKIRKIRYVIHIDNDWQFLCGYDDVEIDNIHHCTIRNCGGNVACNSVGERRFEI